jgi:hypothetical protein
MNPKLGVILLKSSIQNSIAGFYPCFVRRVKCNVSPDYTIERSFQLPRHKNIPQDFPGNSNPNPIVQ